MVYVGLIVIFVLTNKWHVPLLDEPDISDVLMLMVNVGGGGSFGGRAYIFRDYVASM